MKSEVRKIPMSERPSSAADVLDLTGRAALVTGAGQVGRAIATTLAAHGAEPIVVADISGPMAEALADDLQVTGTDAVAVTADITDPGGIAVLGEATRQLQQPVQILVNNAGLPPGFFGGPSSGLKPFAETEPDEWEPVIQLNLYGVLRVTRALLPSMIDSGWGRVITIVSDAGRTGDPNVAAYAAAKAGAAGFMRSLATEVGKYHLTANSISLGTLWRPEHDSAPSPEYLLRLARRYPAGRPGYPQDVANLVLYLASNAAEWITGQVYPLNGGYSYAL
jgi:NAD(P)-dependent dehydrogenase (short-subunit alcohol dehydrogenase family)